MNNSANSELDTAQSYLDAARNHLKAGRAAEAIESCKDGETFILETTRTSGPNPALDSIDGELRSLLETAERLISSTAPPQTSPAEDYSTGVAAFEAAKDSWLPLKISPAGDLEEVREEALPVTDGVEITTFTRREALGRSTFRRVRLSPTREQWFQQIAAGPTTNDAAILSEPPDTEKATDHPPAI